MNHTNSVNASSKEIVCLHECESMCLRMCACLRMCVCVCARTDALVLLLLTNPKQKLAQKVVCLIRRRCRHLVIGNALRLDEVIVSSVGSEEAPRLHPRAADHLLVAHTV